MKYRNINNIWKEAKKGKNSQKTKGQGVYHFSNTTSKLLSILTRKVLKYVEVNFYQYKIAKELS